MNKKYLLGHYLTGVSLLFYRLFAILIYSQQFI